MEFSHGELSFINEAIDERLALLHKLPPGDWRDIRIKTLEGAARKIAQLASQETSQQAGDVTLAQPAVGAHVCPDCGKRVLPSDNFCLNCGYCLIRPSS